MTSSKDASRVRLLLGDIMQVLQGYEVGSTLGAPFSDSQPAGSGQVFRVTPPVPAWGLLGRDTSLISTQSPREGRGPEFGARRVRV